MARKKKKSKKKADPAKAGSDAADSPGDEAAAKKTKKSSSGSKSRKAASGKSSKAEDQGDESTSKKSSSKKATKPKKSKKTAAADPASPDAEAPEREEPGPGEEGPEDLDAVLDEVDADEDLDDLIAATAAGADTAREPDEPELQSLDEEAPDGEAPIVLLDEEDEDAAALAAAVAESVVRDVREDEAPVGSAAESDDAAQEALAATEAASNVVIAPTTAEEASTTVESQADAETREEPPPSSPEELEGAIDLGSVSTPELRDRLLAQTLAHAEQQDARYRVPFSDPRPASRLKAAAAAILFLVALTAAVSPPAWVRPEPPAQIDEAQRARDIRTALLLQAQQLDAYWVREQRLPASLDEIPAQLPGIRYVRSGNRLYQLIAYEQDGNAIVYDSTDPAPEFARIRPGWIEGEGP